ncbi:MAG: N-acetylmuramoyl-L-alanine amidase [Oscillospiraceae bacterium]|nr:N-acetylmuramoyl-L-alanine amidase [Oscillospiraceae bacterium]
MYRKVIVFLLIIILLSSFNIPVFASNANVLYGKVVILDAGHGVETTNFFRGYDEQAAMLALAHKIKPLLEAHGATVHLTRSTPANVLLSARVAMANIWSLDALKRTVEQNSSGFDSILGTLIEIDRLINIMGLIIKNPQAYESFFFNTPFSPSEPIHPDLERIFELQSNPVIADNFLFISLHSNATAIPINTAVHGADVFHISNEHPRLSDYYSNYSHVERSIEFSEILLDYIHETGIQRQTVSPANFFVIREHNLPAVLVENGHHTNTADRTKLMDDEYLDRLAFAYLNAIIDFFSDINTPLTLFLTDLLHSSSTRIRYNIRSTWFHLRQLR